MRQQSVQWSSYALMLCMPLSVYYWALNQPLLDTDFSSAWMSSSFVTIGIHISDIAVAALLIAGTLSGCRWWHLATARWLFTLPLLVIVVLAVMTIPLALDPFFAAYTAVRWLALLAVYLILVRCPIQMEKLVSVLLIGLAIHCLIGLAQVLHEGGNLGIPGAIVAREYARAFGLTVNPNILGGFLLVGILAGLPLATHQWLRIVWWLLWMGLTLTFSRSAWLALLLIFPFAVALLAWRWPPLRPALTIAILGAVIVSLLSSWIESSQLRIRTAQTMDELARAPHDLTEPFALSDEPVAGRPEEQEEQDASDLKHAGRITLLRIALASIAEHPATGVGAGNSLLIEQFGQANFYADYIHNVPLLLAAEIGLVGSAAWLWMGVAALGILILRIRQLDMWAIVWVCAWLALGIISLFDGYTCGRSKPDAC